MLERARAKGAGRGGGAAATSPGVGQCPRAALRERYASTRRRSGSVRATSQTSTAAGPRWPAWSGPAGASSSSRSRRRTRPPLSTFYSVWFDRVVPLIGRSHGRGGGLHLPAELGQALPGAGGRSPRRWQRAGLSDIRWILTAGGIIALHVGRSTRWPWTGPVTEVMRGRGVAHPRPAGPRRAAPRGGGGQPRRAAGRARRVDDRRRGQAPAPAAGLPRRRLPRTARGLVRAAAAVELVHSGHARPRRRPRRRRAAPRPAPPWWPVPGRGAATATGDLLFARAFAELAAQRARRRDQGALRGVVGARRGRAAAARRRLERVRLAGALPAPLRAQDGPPVRGGMPARGA